MLDHRSTAVFRRQEAGDGNHINCLCQNAIVHVMAFLYSDNHHVITYGLDYLMCKNRSVEKINRFSNFIPLSEKREHGRC